MLTSEGSTVLDILTLGAILVGSGTATAILGAAVGAAGTQTLCPYLECAGSTQTLDPIFPLGGAIMGSALAGALGVYLSGAVAAFFFTDDGSAPE